MFTAAAEKLHPDILGTAVALSVEGSCTCALATCQFRVDGVGRERALGLSDQAAAGLLGPMMGTSRAVRFPSRSKDKRT